MPSDFQEGRGGQSDEWAKQYGEDIFGTPKIRRELLEHTEDGRHIYDEVFALLGRDETVLDAGCYDGDDELYLKIEKDHNGRLIGMDPAPKPGMSIEVDDRFNYSLQVIRDYDIKNIQFLHGILQDIPLPDEHVDVAMALWSLIHVPRHEIVKSIDELLRVTKVGGRIMVGTNGINHKPRQHTVLYETAMILGATFAGPFSSGFKLESAEEMLHGRKDIEPAGKIIQKNVRLPITKELLFSLEHSLATYIFSITPTPNSSEFLEALRQSSEYQKIISEIEADGVAYDNVNRGILIYRKLFNTPESQKLDILLPDSVVKLNP